MTRPVPLLLFVMACLTPGILAAETRVRSGEHGSFTRLVFYLPTKVNGWTASRTGNGYEISVSPSPVSLDTSEVFSFIPRTRVRDIGLRNGQVWISSDCDCHLSIFQARPDVIAVDVRDGPDPAADSRSSGNATHPSNDSRMILLSLIGRDFSSAPAEPALVKFIPPKLQAPTVEPNALAVAVARATTGGLLNPSEQNVRLNGPGIETRNALDRAEPDHAHRTQSERCDTLATLEELPDMDPAQAWDIIEAPTRPENDPRARAMAYLSLGFGAEAAAAFAQSDLPGDTAVLLMQVAHSVDETIRPVPNTLLSVRDCEGVAGLIGVLATTADTEISEDQGRDYVATLSRLPSPLRAHLAPRLESRLKSADLSDLALSARFALQRAQEATVRPNPLDGRHPDLAAKTSLPLVSSGLPETPFFQPSVSGSALNAIATGRFAQEDRILIEAWIQEAPSLAEADAATRFYASALNRAGRPLNALSHLDARIGRRGAMRPAIEDAVAETIDTAIRELDPARLMLLDARLAERPWYSSVPRRTREALAERVASVRSDLLGQPIRTADVPETLSSPPVNSPAETDGGPDGAFADRDGPLVSERRRSTEAAISSAADSLARSAQLRTEAAERAEAWARAAPR